MTYKNILQAIENIGIESSFGCQILTGTKGKGQQRINFLALVLLGDYTSSSFVRFIETHRLVREYIAQVIINML